MYNSYNAEELFPMPTETYHNGQLIEESRTTCTTPEGYLSVHNGRFEPWGYDTMIGSAIYNIKSVTMADNGTKMVIKVTSDLSKKLPRQEL